MGIQSYGMNEHIYLQHKERETVLAGVLSELKNAENFDLIIVCKDNRLVHSNRKLLGMWSPMLRNLMGPLWNLEICHLLLPCFSQFTVSKVLRMLTIETENSHPVLKEERELLDCLGVPTKNMIRISNIFTEISPKITDKEYDDDVSSIQKQLLQMIDLSDTSDIEEGEIFKDKIEDNNLSDIEEGEIMKDDDGDKDNESMEEWKYIKKYSEKIEQEYLEKSKNRSRNTKIYDKSYKDSKANLDTSEGYSEEQDNSDLNDSDSTEPYDKKDEESIEFILSQELEDECFDKSSQYEAFENDPDDPS